MAAARNADVIVVERWSGPSHPDAPLLLAPAERIVGVIERVSPHDPPPTNRTGPTHARIGDLVASLIPDEATVQWGPGAVGASVVAALRSRVRVRSGLVTDELVALEDAGLLIGAAEAAYMWGGSRLEEMARGGRLHLKGVDYTHDLSAISSIEGFVAINTALQVGLDGASNVETVQGRVVSGPGGHPDFATGASRSPGGLSVVALPSTAGKLSTIVGRPRSSRLPERTSTSWSQSTGSPTSAAATTRRQCPTADRHRRSAGTRRSRGGRKHQRRQKVNPVHFRRADSPARVPR